MKKFSKFLALVLTTCTSLIASTTSFQKDSLLNTNWKIYSQSGEESVLDQMLKKMNIQKGFFVEFGGCDGKLLSNTRFLAERGWEGAFIECDNQFFPKLYETCSQFSHVQGIKEFVTATADDRRGKTLDFIQSTYFPNKEIDVLSIDIDGPDYLILENLQCRPKIICIESSGYWHPSLKTKIPDEIAVKNLGQPLSVIIDIAKAKGYEPVCFLTVNLFLVRKDFYHLFSSIDNSCETLWLESWNHLKLKQPSDQKYIQQARATDPNIRAYDTYTTPQ